MNILKLQSQRPVANLTLEQQVVKEHAGLESLPGYVLVIFEKQDNYGAIFSRLVISGERFHSRNPFRDLSKKYFAIAVNDSVLSYAFDHSITLDDGGEAFTLNFHLTYRVADHRKVAEIHEQDPLKQLRDEIARVIGRNCAKRKTEMFRNRFRDLERIVIDSESVRLGPYAAELGFKIISIDLDKPSPNFTRKVIDARRRAQTEKDGFTIQHDVNLIKDRTSRAREHELKKEDLDHKYDIEQSDLEGQTGLNGKLDEVHRAEQNRKPRGIQTDAIGKALTKIGEGINTPWELREGFEVARAITVITEPDGRVIPSLAAEPIDANERRGGEAQTKNIGDTEKILLPKGAVNEQGEQNFPAETWKDEAATLINMLDSAGADSGTTTRLRETLEAIGARFFPTNNTSGLEVSILPQDMPALDSVKCSVFAPPEASRGANIMVQVFVHLPEDSEAVIGLAAEFDNQAKHLAAKLLDNEVTRGSKLTFCISMPDLEIDDPVQELIWRGRTSVVQFGVRVPRNLKPQEIVGTVYLSQSGVPFGHAKFLLRIVELQDGRVQEIAKASKVSAWKRYEYAFISYASADRPEVLKRVQMLSRFHIDFFHDLLTLEPGEQWAEAIYQSIARSDVFFLFWSNAARSSEWVMKEIRYALERKGADGMSAPEIVPVIIEGPPPVPPPPELKDIHFNDQFIYFINAG
jgi:hypothetical protein